MDDKIGSFESSISFMISSYGLSLFIFLHNVSHVFTISNYTKTKDYSFYSCFNLFSQLIFNSFFFCVLHRYHMTNTLCLILINLVCIPLNIEWIIIYFYYNIHEGKIIPTLMHSLSGISIPVIVFLNLLLRGELKLIPEIIIINITFVFYVLMFISTGSNIIKFIKTGNTNYINIKTSFLGVGINIFMISFIIILNYYNIMPILYILYPLISLAILCFEIVQFFRNYKNNENIDELMDIDEIEKKTENSDNDKEYMLSSK